MDQPLVSVRGDAVLEVEPETAQLDVAVGARDKHRDETLRRVDERQRAVLAVIESFGDAVERVETFGLRIGPEFKEGRPTERVLGYAAGIRNAVTVVDFAALGDLLARLAELELVDVTGPWWGLRRDSPVYREARVAAARDAVRRAREYAEALGSRLTTVVELADQGLLDSGAEPPFRGPAPGASMAMVAAGHAAPVVLELEPARQVVRASVEARFRMSAPMLEDL